MAEREVWSPERGWHHEGPRGRGIPYTTAAGIGSGLHLLAGVVGLVIAEVANVGEWQRPTLAAFGGLALGVIPILGFVVWLGRATPTSDAAVAPLPPDATHGGWKIALR